MTSSSSATNTIYFDNSLVGAVAKGDHPDQMSALSTLLRHHEQGTVSLVGSTEILGEIQQLPKQYQGPHLDVWNMLRKLPASRMTWIDETISPPSLATDPVYAQLGPLLPDEMDRRHVFHAIKRNVDYFATVDQRTILNRATQIEPEFPIRFGKPTDIVNALGLQSSSSTSYP